MIFCYNFDEFRVVIAPIFLAHGLVKLFSQNFRPKSQILYVASSVSLFSLERSKKVFRVSLYHTFEKPLRLYLAKFRAVS